MLFDYLIQIFRAFLNYFFKPVDMNRKNQKIYVKWTSGIVPVYLNSNWTVSDLKESMSKQIKVSSTDLHIIFAGKELNDDMRLQDCDVGEQSIIHAVPSRKLPLDVTTENDTTSSTTPLGLNFCAEDSSKFQGLADSRKAHFFVYCSDPCKGMTPGKLRVRCSTCKEGTLTVDRDPTCWDDVLLPNRIHGTCHEPDCDGTVAEFYFKCSRHITSPGDSAVALYLIKNNFKNIPCIACTDVKAVVLVFPCADGHVICLECFELYCLSRLDERKFIQDAEIGYTIDCAAGCPDSLIIEPHHFKLLGEVQYSRYQRFAAEECLLQAGGVLCPSPGCGAGLLPDPECRKIKCSTEGGSGCGFVFCRLCLQGYHLGPCNLQESVESSSGFSHAITDERAGTSRWDEDSRNTIQSTTKPCPNCRTPTERDGGCMHIVCTRSQCGFHWCWVCQEEWSRDCMGSHWFG